MSGVVTVDLDNLEMWRKFHQYGTEMTITKPGRRMFPTLRYTVTGLDPNAVYSFHIRMTLVDQHRRKFHNGLWQTCGKFTSENATTKIQTTQNGNGIGLEDSGKNPSSGQHPQAVETVDGADFGPIYQHPDSPASGKLWMRQAVPFHKIKLTNDTKVGDDTAVVVLSSMHKYLPVLLVRRMSNDKQWQTVACRSFSETAFIAVTSYQNQAIIQLKIKFNPFAKGFKVPNGLDLQKSARKLKRHIGQDDDNSDQNKSDENSKKAPTNESTFSVERILPTSHFNGPHAGKISPLKLSPALNLRRSFSPQQSQVTSPAPLGVVRVPVPMLLWHQLPFSPSVQQLFQARTGGQSPHTFLQSAVCPQQTAAVLPQTILPSHQQMTAYMNFLREIYSKI